MVTWDAQMKKHSHWKLDRLLQATPEQPWQKCTRLKRCCRREARRCCHKGEKNEQDGVSVWPHVNHCTIPFPENGTGRVFLMYPSSAADASLPPSLPSLSLSFASGSLPRQSHWAIPHIFHSVSHWNSSRSHTDNAQLLDRDERSVSVKKRHRVFITMGCPTTAALGSSSIINPNNWQTPTTSPGSYGNILLHFSYWTTTGSAENVAAAWLKSVYGGYKRREKILASNYIDFTFSYRVWKPSTPKLSNSTELCVFG